MPFSENIKEYEPQFQLRKVDLRVNSNNKQLSAGDNFNYDNVQRMEIKNNFCFILTKTYEVYLIGSFANTQSFTLKY